MERKGNGMDLVNNPYESITLKEGKGNMVSSVHEHLTAATEICDRNGDKATYDQNMEEEAKQYICLLLGCVMALVREKELTSSSRGRKCLVSIPKQLFS
eukprot:15358953-Ditylum_brightwellii.AAC.1